MRLDWLFIQDKTTIFTTEIAMAPYMLAYSSETLTLVFSSNNLVIWNVIQLVFDIECVAIYP